MSIRNIQKFSFNDFITYDEWHKYNYHKQNRIKEVGLHIADNGKVLVEYIELY